MGNYNSVPTKVCVACNNKVPLSEYHANAKKPDGKRDRCPECIRNGKHANKPGKLVRTYKVKSEQQEQPVNLYPKLESEQEYDGHGYMYVIQEREFIKLHESVYKIGMTNQYNPRTRLQHYPADSCLYLLIQKKDARRSENIVKDMLKARRDIKHRSDIGEEYFEGNITSIIDVVIIS